MRGHCLDCGKALEELNITEEHGEKRLSGFCRRCYSYSNSPLYSDDDILIDERIPNIPPIASYKYSCLPEAEMDTLKQQHAEMKQALADAVFIAQVNNGEIDFTRMSKTELQAYQDAYSRWGQAKALLAKLAESESGETEVK